MRVSGVSSSVCMALGSYPTFSVRGAHFHGSVNGLLAETNCQGWPQLGVGGDPPMPVREGCPLL